MSKTDGNLQHTLARLESLQVAVRPERELSWRAGDSCGAAFRIAGRAALVGVIPSLLALAVLAAMHVAAVEQFLSRSVNVAMLLEGCVLYVLAVGIVSGRVAHRFAYQTAISVPTLALLMAWVVNFSLWGWTWLLVFILLKRS